VTGLLLLLLATGLLVGGAELFVENAAAAARRLGLTLIAVGILLAGAEPEELITGVLASGAGHPGLAAGDALGANVTMLTATLGLAALPTIPATATSPTSCRTAVRTSANSSAVVASARTVRPMAVSV
jgi:cation:H+ antiporter